ncbi:30S ribosomal protein S4e [uncultured archaeon]|nr:30S ribosomal protein S4e [uncultured archaeon]
MSRKGENKKAKAISMPRAVHINRKGNFWAVKTKAGPHNKETSVSLGLVLRDYIGVAAVMKEAKHILNHGEVKVNGVVRADHQFPVGLFDTVAIEKQKLFYRVLLDDKGRLVIKQNEKDLKEKVIKVVKKVMTSKGIQATTNDGRTFMGLKANVGDSVKLALPEGKAGEVIEFKEGALAYITKGAHCSELAVVKQIVAASAKKEKLVKLAEGKEEFETIADNVFIIGKGKSVMADVE